MLWERYGMVLDRAMKFLTLIFYAFLVKLKLVW